MIDIVIKPKVKKFIKLLPPKHQRQVKDRILKLLEKPIPHDSKYLTGYNPYIRIDIGEYRIIYKFNAKKKLITVVLVGKRNDGAVYREFKRYIKSNK
ncbi:MAG: type II toxin-antitoxin system RelE/ParE family toxin [Gammaproteobacteria bacterium]|jgi:mRNA interferase RelE/StbE